MKSAANKPARGTFQARGRARRADILQAARELFSQQGFKRTSLMAVAELAQMTDAGLLYHFPTKTALLLAVIEEGDQEERVSFNAIAKLGGIEAIRGLATWGEILEKNPILAALDVTLSAEHLQDDSEVRTYFVDRYERLRKDVARFFQTAKASGELAASTQPNVEAELLIASLDGLRLQWLLSKGKVSVARGMRAYVQGVLARLAP